MTSVIVFFLVIFLSFLPSNFIKAYIVQILLFSSKYVGLERVLVLNLRAGMFSDRRWCFSWRSLSCQGQRQSTAGRRTASPGIPGESRAGGSQTSAHVPRHHRGLYSILGTFVLYYSFASSCLDLTCGLWSNYIQQI